MVEVVKRILGIKDPLTRDQQNEILLRLRIEAAGATQRLEHQLQPRVEQMRARLRPYVANKQKPPAALVQALRAAEATVSSADAVLAQMHVGIIMIEHAHALQDGVVLMQDTMHVLDATRASMPPDMDKFVEDYREKIDAMREMRQLVTAATQEIGHMTMVEDPAMKDADPRLELTEDEEQRLLLELEDVQADAPVVSRAPAPSILPKEVDPDILAKRRAALLAS